MKKMLLFIALTLGNFPAMANPLIDDIVGDYLADQKRIENLCKKKFPDLPIASCRALVVAGVESIAGKDVDEEVLETTIKSDLKSPEFINSVLVKQYGDTVPLGLEWTSQTLLDTFEPLKIRLFIFNGR